MNCRFCLVGMILICCCPATGAAAQGHAAVARVPQRLELVSHAAQADTAPKKSKLPGPAAQVGVLVGAIAGDLVARHQPQTKHGPNYFLYSVAGMTVGGLFGAALDHIWTAIRH
jgi:hypothetical protein